jgi:alpha-aminoadipate carrier protein LysW
MPTAICPECDEEVYVDAESEQGDVVTCDECGTQLEIVGLDPIELDVHEAHDTDDAHEDEDFESYDYEDDRY